MSKEVSILVVLVALVTLVLPAIAFEQARNPEDAAYQDMFWGDNLSTVYEQQNQYDKEGNFWTMAGFNHEFYTSAEEYSSEGLVFVKNQTSLFALWAIGEDWSMTENMTQLERDSVPRTIDFEGIETIELINNTIPNSSENIVLFARATMPLAEMNEESVDAFVTKMTKEMDLIKSQFYLAPVHENDWMFGENRETLLSAEALPKVNSLTVRAKRSQVSIPSYPMWVDEPEPVIKKLVVAYGDVSFEGWDLDNAWYYDTNGSLTTKIEGRSCTPTQEGLPEGNCPLDRDRNILLLKNNGSEPANINGWKVVWYEDIDPLDRDDYRRVIVEINSLVIPAKEQVEYEYAYPYGPQYISPEGSFFLYNADGTLVDKWGPDPYVELTIVDEEFKDSWHKTSSYPAAFVNSSEFLGLRYA